MTGQIPDKLPRPTPTLPNPNVPLSNGHQWVDAVAQGLAILFLLVMFLFALVNRGLL
jgi:uncharacterized membrane protein